METPTGYFPDLRVQWDIEIEDEHITDVLVSVNGREQRRALADEEGYRVWRASSVDMTPSQIREAREFFKSKRGRFGAFYFFSPEPAEVVDFAVGSVAAETSLIMPAKETTITSVEVGGVDPGGWTITTGVGSGGEDRIDFAGSTTGDVTVTGTIRERVTARFESDILRRTFLRDLAVIRGIFAIEIREVR